MKAHNEAHNEPKANSNLGQNQIVGPGQKVCTAVLTSVCLSVGHKSPALCCAVNTQTLGPACLLCLLAAFSDVPAISPPLPAAGGT